jgi:hypothetical protein
MLLSITSLRAGQCRIDFAMDRDNILNVCIDATERGE